MPDAVQVVGARELSRSLERAGRALGDNADTNARVSTLVATSAQHTAPRRTGRLAGGHRKRATKVDAEVSNTLPYANAQHWGVGPRAGLRGPHNIRGTRWLLDTVQDRQASIVDLYRAKVDRVVGAIRGGPRG